MNNSGGNQNVPRRGPELCSPQHKPNKPIALSKSIVLTDESRIPSLLYVGRLLSTGGAPDMASLPTKLLQEWGVPSASVKFWRVTDGAFLIQFYDRADLTRVMDGTPWCCGDGDDNLFVLQHVKPDVNLVDQVRFSKVELWVQFHRVPVEYFSEASVYKLAAPIGELVSCPDFSSPSPVQFLRARIRVDVTLPLVQSVDVMLEDGNRESVSVEYERIPSLCGYCRILGHPADRCSRGGNHQLPPDEQPPRRDREKPPIFARTKSRFGSLSRSASSTTFRDDGGGSVGSSSSAGSGSSLPPPPPETAAAAISPINRPFSAMGDGGVGVVPLPPPEIGFSSSPQLGSAPTSRRRFNFNFRKFLLFKKRNLAGQQLVCNTVENMEDTQRSQMQQAVLLTFSAEQNAKEDMVMEAGSTIHELTTQSRFQLGGRYINYHRNVLPRKNPRIEVNVETQCSPQLITQTMEWLSKKGLMALYDGKRGIIRIVGMQIDQNMGPVDLVAYVYPEIRPKAAVAEACTKPDSPARFEKMVVRFHDENCCPKSNERNVSFSSQ